MVFMPWLEVCWEVLKHGASSGAAVGQCGGRSPAVEGRGMGGEGDRARWGVSDGWGGRTTPGVMGDVKRMVEL